MNTSHDIIGNDSIGKGFNKGKDSSLKDFVNLYELHILLAFPGQYTEARFTLGMLNKSLISTTGLRLLENMD